MGNFLMITLINYLTKSIRSKWEEKNVMSLSLKSFNYGNENKEKNLQENKQIIK